MTTDAPRPEDPYGLIEGNWPAQSESAYRSAAMLADKASVAAGADQASTVGACNLAATTMKGATDDAVESNLEQLANTFRTQQMQYQVIDGLFQTAAADITKTKIQITSEVTAGTVDITATKALEESGQQVDPSSGDLIESYQAAVASWKASLDANLASVTATLSNPTRTATPIHSAAQAPPPPSSANTGSQPSIPGSSPNTAKVTQTAATTTKDVNADPTEAKTLPPSQPTPQQPQAQPKQTPAQAPSSAPSQAPSSAPSSTPSSGGSPSSGGDSGAGAGGGQGSGGDAGSGSGSGGDAGAPSSADALAGPDGAAGPGAALPGLGGLSGLGSAAGAAGGAVQSAAGAAAAAAGPVTATSASAAGMGRLSPLSAPPPPMSTVTPGAAAPSMGAVAPPATAPSASPAGMPAMSPAAPMPASAPPPPPPPGGGAPPPMGGAPPPPPAAPAPPPVDPRARAQTMWATTGVGPMPQQQEIGPNTPKWLADADPLAAHAYLSLSAVVVALASQQWETPVAVGISGGQAVYATSDGLSVWPSGMMLPAGVVPLCDIADPAKSGPWLGRDDPAGKLAALADVTSVVSTADSGEQVADLFERSLIPPMGVSRGFGADAELAESLVAMIQPGVPILDSPDQLAAELRQARWSGGEAPGSYRELLSRYLTVSAISALAGGDRPSASWLADQVLRLKGPRR